MDRTLNPADAQKRATEGECTLTKMFDPLSLREDMHLPTQLDTWRNSGRCHTKAPGISSPGTDEASLAATSQPWRVKWNTMSDWTFL